ncbi:MAG: ERCC4 domain-containing protein [Nitrososphaeraceae archaeon]
MPLRIVIDEREKNSKVPSFLTESGIYTDFAQLNVGDYILSHDIAIERKTISDLISSIYDGRLYVQCSELLKFYSKPVVIIEGNILNTFSNEKDIQEKISMIYDALASITIFFRIPIIHTPSAEHTSKFLIVMLNKATKQGLTGPLLKKIKKSNQIEIQQLSILSSLPGIGDKLAIKLLNKFHTPLKALNASTAELAMIPGLGNTRAEKIKKILSNEFNHENTNTQNNNQKKLF